MIAAARLRRATGATRLALRLAGMELRTNGGRFDRRLLSRGLLSSRRALYPIGSAPVDGFLTDVEIEGPLSIANPRGWRRLLKDKLVARGLLERRVPDVRQTCLAGIVADGRAVALMPDGPAQRPLIAKPVTGGGGRSVVLLERGAPLPASGTYLLELPVAAHGYAASIFRHALNTLRVMVARSPRTAEAFVLGAAHRFGTGRSAPADNHKAGGVVAEVDLSTGILSGVVLADTRTRRVSDNHPETAAPVRGVAVPFWLEARALALRCADAFPDLVLVGCDVAIAKDGPLLVEMNVALPNPNLLQMHRPILVDARARDFFWEVGVISEARWRRATTAAAGAASG